ncbi:hypothetical protein [Paraburkholderia sp. BCC1885]|uniref:hypothetical protein n=1 Tax=Paraburkholderia sp. BCC1885 TaxID=2562669 RepID=UPI00164270CD|nr:hypothetical protein [Paraburkholderia sp. BCC1885]
MNSFPMILVLLLIVLFAGAFMGFIAASLCIAAKDADEAWKKFENESDAPYPRIGD